MRSDVVLTSMVILSMFNGLSAAIRSEPLIVDYACTDIIPIPESAIVQAKVDFKPWSGTYSVGPSVDILVNATSIGLYPDVEAMPEVDLKGARSDLLVCDVVPNPPQTRLIQAARSLGLKTLTGLPMLVYQGAIGFEMWTGHKAPEAAMKAALEQAFR